MNVARKKILLFGFISLLLVGIPLAIYSLRLTEETRSRAQKATTVSFTPESTIESPIKKAIGDEIVLKVHIKPGTNIVSFAKLEIQYDETKLATAPADAFKGIETVFPVTLEGPTYAPGKITVTLSVGSDPTKAIQTEVDAATIRFKALANTNGTPTNVTYGNNTEILSIGGTDQASENVLLTVNPAIITIGDTSGTTPSVTQIPTATLVPNAPTATTQPVQTTTPPAASPTVSVVRNQLPVCTALNIDRQSTGSAPYSVTFTGVGNDPDGTVSKVTFNYGDGPTETVTDSGGIGTNAVNIQKSHTYQNPGTYQAFAMLTDNANGVSDQAACKSTIIVLAPTGGVGGPNTNPTTPPINPTVGSNLTPFPTVTLKPGPGDVFIGAGAVAVGMMVLGGLLFLVL